MSISQIVAPNTKGGRVDWVVVMFLFSWAFFFFFFLKSDPFKAKIPCSTLIFHSLEVKEFGYIYIIP